MYSSYSMGYKCAHTHTHTHTHMHMRAHTHTHTHMHMHMRAHTHTLQIVKEVERVSKGETPQTVNETESGGCLLL